MDLTHRPTKLLVTGKSGSGKTTFWTRYLLGEPAKVRFIFDHEGELAYRLKVPPAFDVQALAEGVARGWCIFDPCRMFPGRQAEGFRFFCDFAFQVSSRFAGRKIFGCDELQKLVDTHDLPVELATLLETGRRQTLDMAVIASQPNCIHNRLRGQMTEVVTFQHVEANALKWLEGCGFQAAEVTALRPGGFIARNLNSGAQESGNVF